MATANHERLIGLRRDLHRYPEPSWREFFTTARIVEELEYLGVDEWYVGDEAIDPAVRAGVPDDDEEFDRWADRAIAAGADADIVSKLEGGRTGVVAVLDRGEGPHIGLRVDIDALLRQESEDPSHRPAMDGFRSANEGVMHACGHDGHIAIGIGVIEAVMTSNFSGRLTVGFQPAEEVAGGGLPMTKGGHFDEVDYLLGIHLGMGYPTGTIVGGFDEFLAVSHVEATFRGAGTHAGAKPESGRNAIFALATAIQNLYGISRHSDGLTRVNVGKIGGGSASNIVAEQAWFEGEVRGGTTALRDFMKQRAETVISTAAEMHDCDVEISYGSEAPSANSDEALAEVVSTAAEGVEGVDEIVPISSFRASEDATFLMKHVQDRGGLATYVGIGTDHPGGHHTATFDVDETSIRIGVDVLTNTIRAISEDEFGEV